MSLENSPIAWKTRIDYNHSKYDSLIVFLSFQAFGIDHDYMTCLFRRHCNWCKLIDVKCHSIYEQNQHSFHMTYFLPSLCSSADTVEDLRKGGCWFDLQFSQYSFGGLMLAICYRFHSSLTIAPCFNDGHVQKQEVALNENFAQYW